MAKKGKVKDALKEKKFQSRCWAFGDDAQQQHEKKEKKNAKWFAGSKNEVPFMSGQTISAKKRTQVKKGDENANQGFKEATSTPYRKAHLTRGNRKTLKSMRKALRY